MGRSMKYRSSDSVFFFPREGGIQVNSPGELLTASLLSKCVESFVLFFPGEGGGEMLVAPHRVAAGQRFGLGSGPVGQDVLLLVDCKSFTTLTISSLCSGIGCFHRN